MPVSDLGVLKFLQNRFRIQVQAVFTIRGKFLIHEKLLFSLKLLFFFHENAL